MDACSKQELADILYGLKARGKQSSWSRMTWSLPPSTLTDAVCFFDGKIVSLANPVKFFSANAFYTTAASRISRVLYKNAVTVDMVTEICLKNGLKDG